MQQRGFTLIELLVVLALIAILASVLIVVIRPQEIFRRARDTQRSGDLRNLDQALAAYIAENAQTGNINLDNQNNVTCRDGTGSTTIYVSVGVGTTGTTGLSPFTRTVGTTSKAVDGTGWLPVNFGSISILQLANLPLDPVNSTSSALFYAYGCRTDFNYELTAQMEANLDAEINDGGDTTWLYEVGPAKNILPNGTSTNANWWYSKDKP